MRNLFLLLGLIFTMGTLNAQYYFSLSGGASVGANKKVVGLEVTESSSEEIEGSYGEGFTVQGRFGYYVTPTIAIDLGVGYLHGADQQFRDIQKPSEGTSVDFKTRGRAVGMSLGAKIDISDNIYVRAAGLTKISGKTEFYGTSSQIFPAQLLNPAAPAGSVVTIRGDVERELKGKFSLGFLGALGYQYYIAENVAVFGEIEYFGINIERNTNNFVDFTGAIGDQPVNREDLVAVISTLPAEQQAQMYQLYPVFGERKYVDNPSAPDELVKEESAPYSSLGLNVGVTFKF